MIKPCWPIQAKIILCTDSLVQLSKYSHQLQTSIVLGDVREFEINKSLTTNLVAERHMETIGDISE